MNIDDALLLVSRYGNVSSDLGETTMKEGQSCT